VPNADRHSNPKHTDPIWSSKAPAFSRRETQPPEHEPVSLPDGDDCHALKVIYPMQTKQPSFRPSLTCMGISV
jgi:hypothetical protein